MEVSWRQFFLVVVLSVFILFGIFNMVTFIISSLIIIFLLTDTTKTTAGVFLLWIFVSVSGLWSMVLGIPKAGLLTVIIALILLYSDKRNYEIDFKKGIFYFSPLVVIFILFYLFGPMHSYAKDKMIFIVYRGLLFLIAFLVLFNNSRVDYLKLSLLILFSVYQYYCFAAIATGWNGTEGILDFGSLRRYNQAVKRLGAVDVVNYQEVGLLAVLSLSFLINQIPRNLKISKANIYFFLCFFSCLLLVLYSGSRQSLYSLPFIVFIVVFFDTRISRKIKLIFTILSIVVVATFIYIESENKESNLFLSEGRSLIEKINRPEEISHAMNLIKNKPLMGTGLGGFTPFYNNSRYYPHNIILELISELGFVGFSIILFYIFGILYFSRVDFSVRAKSQFLIFPIFITLFIRANLSSDLIETIYVFSFLVALAVYGGNKSVIMD